jgi:tellurite resistance protein
MDDALRDRAASWYHREHFGFTKPPPEPDLQAMAIALVTVANGDRQVTPDERNWIVGYFAAKGYSPVVVRQAMAVAPIDLRAIPELMQTGTLRNSARILVYDAIRVAAVDGYHPGENKAVREIAFALGLDEQAVADIEALVREEEALRARRIAVLMPEGHPHLEPRFARSA